MMNRILRGFKISKSSFPLDYTKAKKNPVPADCTLCRNCNVRVLCPVEEISKKILSIAQEQSLHIQNLKAESNFTQSTRTLIMQIYAKIEGEKLGGLFSSEKEYWSYLPLTVKDKKGNDVEDSCLWGMSFDRIIMIVFEEYFNSSIASKSQKGINVADTLKKMKESYNNRSYYAKGQYVKPLTLVSDYEVLVQFEYLWCIDVPKLLNIANMHFCFFAMFERNSMTAITFHFHHSLQK